MGERHKAWGKGGAQGRWAVGESEGLSDLKTKQPRTSEEVRDSTRGAPLTKEVPVKKSSSILQHCWTIKSNEDKVKWGSMNKIMCGGPHEHTGLGGGVCSIMRSGARDDVIYRSTKGNRDWAVCGMASLKTSRENNSHLLRCFIEPKYLKKIDKIMLHCCDRHKYFFSSSRNPHFLQYIQKQTWPQGAFH